MNEGAPHPESSQEYLKERSRQLFIGAAVGDTLGMPIEGWTSELISKYLGDVGLPLSGPDAQRIVKAHPGFDPADFPKDKFLNRQLTLGEWTDDTALLMAVADGMIRAGGFDLDSVAEAHVTLYRNMQDIDPDGGWGAFGKTTLTALKRLAEGVDPRESGVNEPWARGNGPALKTAPIGLHAFKTGRYEEGLMFAREVGEMTHKNPASVISGVVQAHAVYALLEGVNQSHFLEECADVALGDEDNRTKGLDYLTPKLKFISEHPDMSDEETYKVIGNRFTVTQNYPFALFMFNKYWDNPTEGIEAAVRLGGDADSVGAIMGALAGARGIEMPEKWQGVLKDKDLLEEMAENLVKI